ncbi:general stress protein [Aminobacter sp. Y103A]|uniref:General stress protein n=1 Tax=Aminobacter aminovorans TaxID=83263 RepID=A0AAC9APR7_AMIAI|nr:MULTISPECIES: pyridoxamine 5'-phosphate oxidase family protein [Aminobacter]AMS39298.1 General stress protein [Aminobacter aminovorans]MBB3709155.1 general stress protein 26 [Aminobacter aminovorans]MRX32561.1 general stress protein [Aminobacter sp. MDW-2]QNH34765.1 pyridoxamine 5'-phosphate oxidase family protein [Aminobacter sp. MDW-2]WMC97424.1 pyridoxamine 5'-phosphate oxidase family protein [Aminobacter aminovorans]
MADKREFEAKFWKSIRSDMTVMVSVSGFDPRPMTAQFDGERKTIYFFTASDTELAGKLARARKATLVYAAKKHDLFATVHGTLRIDGDRSTIDRLWNRFVAAWFEKGKDDPKLRLLRFEPADAQIWLDASSLVAGVKMFLGLGDPKQDYKDSVAKVPL